MELTAHAPAPSNFGTGRREGGCAVSGPPDRDGGIQITPEMIAAGCAELDGFVARDIADGFVNPADVVAAIYRAMFVYRPQE
jgi:hypothetical protein